MITADPAADSPIEGTETLGPGAGGPAAGLRDRRGRRRRHRRHPLHLRHHRPAQGRRADAPQHALSNALASDALFGADADNPDTLLCVLPLFHSFGQTVIMNAGFAFGGTVVLLPRFEAGPALTLMEQEDVTFFAGVPTMYWGLLGALDDSGVDVKKLAGHHARRGRRRVGAAGRGAQGVRAAASASRSSRATGSPRPRRSPASRSGASPHASARSARPIPGVEMKLINPEPGVRRTSRTRTT